MLLKVVKSWTLSLALATVLTTGSVFASSQQANDNNPIVTESMVNQAIGLTQSVIVSLDVPAAHAAAMNVTVPFEGNQYELILQPHSVRSPKYQVVVRDELGNPSIVPPGPVLTKRGHVNGFVGSIVAATAEEAGFSALIQLDADTKIWVQPLSTEFDGVSSDMHAVYREEWVFCDDTKKCGVEDGLTVASGGAGAAGGAKGTCTGNWLAEVACEADGEYHNNKGSVANVENAINTIFNAVNVQYDTQVDIIHNITTINVWTSAGSDPYTTSNPSTLLNQFRNYWNANMGGVQRDVAHYFTGKNLSGSVIGIAYLSAICTNNGYGISQNIGGASCRSDLTAHELGHNWSANHCSCPGNTMNSGLTCANNFTTNTRNTIRNYANNRPCLDCDTSAGCEPDLAGGGPGASELSLCGNLGTGGTADLLLVNTAAPFQIGFIIAGPNNVAVPFKGGFLYPSPFSIAGAFSLDVAGEFEVSVAGGGGPFDIFLQAIYNSPGLPLGVGISNLLDVHVDP